MSKVQDTPSFILPLVLLIETGNLYVWSLTSAILIAIRNRNLLALIRHQTEVVVAVDNRQDLLAITTLQVQTNQEGWHIARIADFNLANPLFTLLNKALATDGNRSLWQFRKCLEIILLLTHHVEVVRYNLVVLLKRQLDVINSLIRLAYAYRIP